MTWAVWGHHVRLDVYDDTHTHRVEEPDLVVLAPDGQEIQRYRGGEWSSARQEWAAAAGPMSCTFLIDDPDCPRCHPPERGEQAAAPFTGDNDS
jgi:hypothetical protein